MIRISAIADFIPSFTHFAKDIKLSHSVFALPFAASAFWLGHLPAPTLLQVFLLLCAMVFARSFAMGANRYLDAKVDELNPRTKIRAIPRGALAASYGLAWTLLSGVFFIVASFLLSETAGYCSFAVLLILWCYPLFKRFSWFAHLYLGVCLGLSPIAVSVALVGGASISVLLLGAGIAFWTCGFDILYALQDYRFDQRVGLYSVPVRFGVRASVWISRACFVSMVACLLCAGFFAAAGSIYYVGVVAVAFILGLEHYLVRDINSEGESKWLNVSFFNLNACVSIIYFIFTGIDAFRDLL